MSITSIILSRKYLDKQKMMDALARENFCVEKALADCDPQLIAKAHPMALSVLDAKVKEGSSLSFEEAFSGMLLVVSATNSPIRKRLFPGMSFLEAVAKGSSFLTSMAIKESFLGLSPEEIAGMVAAGTLDIVFRPSLPQVVETCGMGGDRGWKTKEVKTINASTLSALVLASLGIPTFKHGSYGNTTKIGSVDVPINFGADICHHSSEQILGLFERTNFWFSGAHSVKTIHYLSHLLMIETVNHIIGPMTIPIAKETILYKIMGVNHHVNPEAIARSYTILHRKGFVNLGGVIVVSGLNERPQNNEYLNPQWIKEHAFLDEVSPRATLVSLARGNEFFGDFLLTHEDFDAPTLPEDELKVKNTASSLMRADEAALRGESQVLSDYLAGNAALGLLVFEGLDNSLPFVRLPEYYRRCLKTIRSGTAFQTLRDYVELSGGKFKGWL